MAATDIHLFPVHLGLGATVVSEPEFTGAMEWYAGYAERHVDDGDEARLVSLHRFSGPWDVWEMHPRGAELVLCTEGSITLLHETDQQAVLETTLLPGQYAINAPGVWHTADVATHAVALFITAGAGTQHRAR